MIAIISMCFKIFFARIADVTLGTIRTIYLVKGRVVSPFIISFLELLIWFFTARSALNAEGNIYLIGIFYASGYATGTLLGSLISHRCFRNLVMVQIVTNIDSNELIGILRNKGYGVSVIELKNTYNGINKDMIYIEINSRKLRELTNVVKMYDKNAFIVINETKSVYNGILK